MTSSLDRRSTVRNSGWHWGDGTKPSHTDGGPNDDGDGEERDIESEPEDPETSRCPESLEWVEEHIAREKEDESVRRRAEN